MLNLNEEIERLPMANISPEWVVCVPLVLSTSECYFVRRMKDTFMGLTNDDLTNLVLERRSRGVGQ